MGMSESCVKQSDLDTLKESLLTHQKQTRQMINQLKLTVDTLKIDQSEQELDIGKVIEQHLAPINQRLQYIADRLDSLNEYHIHVSQDDGV